MTIYATPYDTTVGKGLVVSHAVQELQQAIITTGFPKQVNTNPIVDFKTTEGVVPTLVTRTTLEEVNIPYYAHPVLVDFSIASRAGERYVVGDARPFIVNATKPGEDLHVKNTAEFNFCRARTALTALWINEGTTAFRYLAPVPVGVYASWVSENIARRFALDGGDQQLIAIAAAFHYYSLFDDTKVVSEDYIERIAYVIAKATFASTEKVIQLMKQNPQMSSLQDMIDTIKVACANPRLDNLNVGVLVEIIAFSWYGTNAREIAAVALEHPPTFLVMVFNAFSDRTYRNSPLARLAERYRGNKGGDEFVRSLQSLMRKATTAN